MTKILLVLLVAPITFTALALSGSPSLSASPVCVAVTTYETSIGEHDVTPPCAPYPFTTTCNYQEFGLEPTLAVTTTVCVPRP